MKPKPSSRKKTADRYFALLVKLRGRCERCGLTGGPFDCAHIIRRWYSNTRCDARNAWCLCRTCHEIIDGDDPRMRLSLIESTIGWDVFDELQLLARCGDKVDWDAVATAIYQQWKAAA